MTKEYRKEVLKMVDEIVNNDRCDQYGEPEDNFKIIADAWTWYINNKYPDGFKELNGEDVGLMMVLFKITRQMHQSKLDNFIDAIGYAVCVTPEEKKISDFSLDAAGIDKSTKPKTSVNFEEHEDGLNGKKGGEFIYNDLDNLTGGDIDIIAKQCGEIMTESAKKSIDLIISQHGKLKG